MRKLIASLVLVGACLLASTSPAPAAGPPCTYICCNDYSPDTECTAWPYQTTCYTWWHEGGECP